MRPGTLAGLPQGQENSGKTKKEDKSQEKWGFLKKKSGKVRRFDKN